MDQVPCPWCKQLISSEEAQKIRNEVDEKNKKEYEISLEKYTTEKDNEISSLKLNNEEKIEKNKQQYEEIIKNNDESHKSDLTNLQSQVDEAAKEKSELLIARSDEQHDEQIRSLTISLNNITKTSDEYKKMLDRKNKEIDVFKQKSDTRQTHQIASDGEGILLDKLRKAFPTDRFETQNIGKAVADISQTIIENNKLYDTKICFDNKENTGVVLIDYDKAKKYMKEHNTEHVIIVSSKLPAEFGSNFIGIKNGILICHPDIITIISKIIRNHIIQMEGLKITSIDPNEKSMKLYDYLMNNTFDLQMRTVCNSIVELRKLQSDEVQKSETRWTKQTVQFKTLEKSLLEIVTNIETISGKQFTNEFLTILKQS